MKHSFWIFSIFSLLMLAGCSSYTVVSDYDRSMPFYDYKTYRWTEQARPGAEDDILANNPLIYKRIKKEVDRELAAKGFILKERGPVDFTINAHANVRERVFIDPPLTGFGYYHGWHRRGYMPFWYDPCPYPAVRYYEEGTLIIDIFDNRSNDIAWRGVARGILKNYRSTESLRRDINKVVEKIIAQFPPLVR
ncbi:MAG TPA: DUF4136 domain-containing protein [Chlorobaculum parvum]|uniref:DUF4136 domain-containing protein n=1 Tax=Chlorobaculum parvum TaxID=274539 RepID=A0A7C5HPY8_9CHLB|nr:DUF4136 domain-containing protein [Chlorobaculum parvum]